MTSAIPCVDRAALERFRLGQLPEPEAESVVQHLMSCPRCLETVQNLKVEDTLLDALGKVSGVTLEEPLSPEVRRLMERFSKLPAASPPAQRPSRADASTGSAPTLPPLAASGDALGFLAPAQSPDELGRLGPHRILKVLGAGGMGTVFLAEDSHLQRFVALKAMKPALAASTAARERFLREARATAKVKHDHVVTIHQVGEDRGIPFIAMELLEGETLEARLHRQRKLRSAEVLRLGQEIARGLAAAHQRGLLHRDIKPANIWLEKKDEGGRMKDEPETGLADSSFRLHPSSFRVKILDFGLARAASGDAQLTQEGAIIGTPAYMAPEQATNTNVDHRCDLFSLGCVLYRMATGVPPFKGTDTISTLMSVATDQPPAPCLVNLEVPAEISDYIMKLLEKNPEKRPASAQEVAERLRALEREPPTHESPANKQPPHQPRAQASEARKRPRALWAAAALALLGLLAVTWFYGGTIIRFASNEGELVIEIADDARIEVTIKDGEAIVHDKAKDRKYVLTAGKDYEVQVRELGEDGVKFDTKRFTITRGGQAKFDARMGLPLAKAADKIPPVAVADPTPAKLTDLEQALLTAINAERAKANVPPLVANATLMKAARRHADDMARWDNLTHVSEDKNPFERMKEAGYEHKGAGENVATLQQTPAEVVRDWLASPGHKQNLLNPKFLEVGMGISRSAKNQPYSAAMFAAPVNLPRTTDPDRRAAEWVLQLKGTLVISVGAQETRVVAAGGLPSGPFEVTEISFLGNRDSAIDAGLHHLRGLKQLKVLNLMNTSVSNQGLQHVQGLQSLRKLYLVDTKVTDAGMPWLAGLRNLEILWLHYLPLTDAGISHLKDLRELRNLALPKTQITQTGLKHLSGMSKLDDLSIDGTNVNDDALAELQGLRALKNLVLVNTPVTGPGLRHLQALPELNTLQVGGPALTDAAFTHVAGLKNLHWLEIVHADQVTDAGLAHLRGMTWLKTFRVTSPHVTEKGIAHIGNMAQLFELRIHCQGVNDAALPHLSRLRRLEVLDLSASGITGSGIGELPELPWLRQLELIRCPVTDEHLPALKKLPGLRVLVLMKTRVTDAGILHLKELKTLTEIRLAETAVSAAGRAELQKALPNCRVEPMATAPADPDRRAAEWVLKLGGELLVAGDLGTWIKELGRLPQQPFRLQHINLSSTKVSDAELVELQGLTGLQALRLNRTGVSDVGLEKLIKLNELTILEVGGTRVSNLGLEYLKRMPKLERLDVGATRVTDPGLVHLGSLTTLRHLGIYDNEVSDRGLEHLSKLAGLQRLDVHSTNVTAEGVKKLATALPSCKIDSDYGSPSAADPDRRAAEWVLKAGGTVAWVGGDPRMTKDVSALPSTPFRLQRIGLLHCKQVSDDGLAHLQHLTELESLDLGGARPFTDAGLAHLRGLSNLRDLNLTDTSLTNAGLPHLRGLARLKRLVICETQVDDDGLQHIAALRELETLALDSTRITNAGLVHIRNLKNLKNLSLWETGVTDDGLKSLEPLQELRELNLGEQITDAGLIHIRPLTQLRRLSFWRTQVSDAGLKHLQELKRLEHLGLGPAKQFTGEGLAYLSVLPMLRILELNETSVSDAALVHVKGLSNLEHLGLNATLVGDRALEHLTGLKKLGTLKLAGTKITDAGLASLHTLQSLRELELRETKVTAAGVKKLAAALPQCWIHTDHGTFGPKTPVAGAPGSPDPDRRAAEWVSLQGGTMNLEDNQGKEVHIPRRGSLPAGRFRLKDVDLADAAIGPDLANLKGLGSLGKLDLVNTKVGDAGLEDLAGMKSLKVLLLTRTPITDAAVVHLLTLSGLTSLDVTGTKLTPDGIKRLRTGLPKCNIAHD